MIDKLKYEDLDEYVLVPRPLAEDLLEHNLNPSARSELQAAYDVPPLPKPPARRLRVVDLDELSEVTERWLDDEADAPRPDEYVESLPEPTAVIERAVREEYADTNASTDLVLRMTQRIRAALIGNVKMP